MHKVMMFNLQLKNTIRIVQLVKMNQLAKSYSGKIYVVTKNKNVIDAASFSALISLFLTSKSNRDLNFMVEGPYPQLKANDIVNILSSLAIINKTEHLYQTTLKIKH